MNDDSILLSLPEISDKNIDEIINEAGKTQPYLTAYILTYEEDDLDSTEQAILFDLYILIWFLRTKSELPPPLVSTNVINEKQQNNSYLSKYLENESNEDIHSMIQILIENYKSFELYELISRILHDEFLRERVRDKNYGLLLGGLKTVIDCLEDEPKTDL